jgi:hypothetical protein
LFILPLPTRPSLLSGLIEGDLEGTLGESGFLLVLEKAFSSVEVGTAGVGGEEV